MSSSFAGALLSVAALSCILLAVTSWNRRTIPGAVASFVMLCGIFLWTAASAMQLLLDLEGSLWLTTVVFAGIALLPPAWLCMAIQSTGRSVHRMVVLAGIVLWAITMAVVATNELHFWVWRPMLIDGNLVRIRWWFFWGFFTYAQATVSIGVVLLWMNLIHSSSVYRWQSLTLAVAGVVPLLVNFLYALRIIPRMPFDPTQLAFLASVALCSWALFRLRVLELVPIPAEMLIERISDGLLVIDRQERIINLNPVAAKIFEHEEEGVIGRPAAALTEDWSLLKALCLAEGNARGEICLRGSNAPIYIEAATTALTQGKRGCIGHLLLIRDISESRRREAVLEQLVTQLQSALEHVKTLTGLLPICCMCKKIRDKQNDWQHLESYLSDHSEAEFTHGLCPECLEKCKSGL